MPNVSPFLKLPLRSLEHVLREREAMPFDRAAPGARYAVLNAELDAVRERIARIELAPYLDAPVYTAARR